MSENLDQIYYQPVRDRAENSKSIFVWDSSAFIPFAKATVAGFSILKVFPLLANHGHQNVCAEMVSYESAQVFRDGSNTGRFYTLSDRHEDTDAVLRPFFRSAVREGDIAILPAVKNGTAYERKLEDIFSLTNTSKAEIYNQVNRRSHIDQKDKHKIISAHIHRVLKGLSEHKDAGETATKTMIDQLGPLRCPLVYVARNFQAMAMMRAQGAVTIDILGLLEVLKQKKILGLLDSHDGCADGLIKSIVEYRSKYAFNPERHAAYIARNVHYIDKVSSILGDITEKELAKLAEIATPAETTPARPRLSAARAEIFSKLAGFKL